MLTKKLIGDSYEYYVLDQIKNDYDKIWHWKDFPESILYELNIIRNYDIFSKYRYDIGADLVAKKDDIYYFIQCKNFKDTILMDQLAGFYFLLYEYNLNGILYYNGNLSQRVKDLSNRVKLVNLPFNNQNIKIALDKNNLIIPRDYQLDAYNKLKNYNKCILQLPCGMGKTYIASLLAKDYDNIIILSPLRSLAQQLLNNFNQYLNYEYNPILISMDGHRKIDIINTFIKEKNIISSTFDSANILIQFLDKFKNVLLIIDEFHNLSYSNLNNKEDYIYQIRQKLNKQLYLSATPIKEFICDYKYEYSWQDAIKNKFICDFQIIIHENNEELYQFAYILKNLCSEELNVKLIGKSYFILKGLMYYGNRKCICYMTCLDKAKQMKDILYWLSKFLNIELETNIITFNTSKTNRYNYLNNFKNATKLSIIINVHILDEGIDIPECDSVFITQPNNNIINIVQRMCRANRIIQSKDKCYIYLWCNKNKTDKILNYLADNTSGIINNKIVKFKIDINNNISNNKYTLNNIELSSNYGLDNYNIDKIFIKLLTKKNEHFGEFQYNHIEIATLLGYGKVENYKYFTNFLKKELKLNQDYIIDDGNNHNFINNNLSDFKKGIKLIYRVTFNGLNKIIMMSNKVNAKKYKEQINKITHLFL